MIKPELAPTEQLEARLGRLEDIPAVFVFLKPSQQAALKRLVLDDVELAADLFRHAAGAAQLADKHAARIADQCGLDVLVAARDAPDGVHVHPALVREGRLTDVGLRVVRDEVGQFTDVAAHLGDPFEPAGNKHVLVHFQGEVGSDRRQVRVAAPLPDAVDRPLRVDGTVPHGRQRVGHRQAGVVVRVDPDPNRQARTDCLDADGHLLGQ